MADISRHSNQSSPNQFAAVYHLTARFSLAQLDISKSCAGLHVCRDLAVLVVVYFNLVIWFELSCSCV